MDGNGGSLFLLVLVRVGLAERVGGFASFGGLTKILKVCTYIDKNIDVLGDGWLVCRLILQCSTRNHQGPNLQRRSTRDEFMGIRHQSKLIKE